MRTGETFQATNLSQRASHHQRIPLTLAHIHVEVGFLKLLQAGTHILCQNKRICTLKNALGDAVMSEAVAR